MARYNSEREYRDSIYKASRELVMEGYEKRTAAVRENTDKEK